MKRVFDLSVAVLLATVGLIPLAIVATLVKLTSKGPVFYWSDRIGRNNRIFSMPKFRTMRIDSPEVASHLLTNPEQWLTPIGDFLRRTSLDEMPQLWSILRGDMSLVGPRPALHNQYDLIALRTLRGVHELVPGLTGWAQINGRDESPIPRKVALDADYLRRCSFWFDLKILALTFLQVTRAKGTTVPGELLGVDQGTSVPSEAFVALAAAWFDQGAYEKAIAAYDHALTITPDDAATLSGRNAARAALLAASGGVPPCRGREAA
jgi:O-antigen biosynthesis protein WbqP